MQARGWGKRLIRLLRATGIAYVVCVLLAMAFESAFIYHPVQFAAQTPEVPTNVRPITLRLPEGVLVRGWFASPSLPTRRTVLFFHGNGGSIWDRQDLLALLIRDHCRVLMLDYPGYGQSGGTPSERGLYETASAAWYDLTVTEHIPASQIIVFGESLGNAPAIDLAARTRPAGLIVQSAFTSMTEMAAQTLPWVPSFCVRSKMDNLAKIRNVACPILLIHSTGDDVIPYPMGRRLFEAARAPRTLLTLHGAHHNDTQDVGGNVYADAVADFLRGVCPP